MKCTIYPLVLLLLILIIESERANTVVPSVIFVFRYTVYIVCLKNICILSVSAFTENYCDYYMYVAIANEMHDLSARVKFPDARFQIATVDNFENCCRDTRRARSLSKWDPFF